MDADMDADMVALSLLELPLELDDWLLESPGSSRAQAGVSVPPVAHQWTLAAEPKGSVDALTVTAPTSKPEEPTPEPEQEQEQAPPVKRARRGKSSSQRQKEEIASLRQQASDLQAQAARLRDDCERSQALGPCHGPSVASVWVGIAKRQEGERTRATDANAKLRDVLTTHAKLVRRLGRVLRKAEEWSHIALPSPMEWLAPEPWRDDGQIFSLLVKSVEEQVFPQLDEVMKRQLRLPIPKQVDHESPDRLRSDAFGSHYTEHKDSKLLPFSYRMVDEVSWRSMRTGQLQFGLKADATITQAEDLMACQVCVRSSMLKRSLDSDTERIRMYLVLKRYSQANRVAYVWETLGLLPASKELHVSPVRLVGRGWCESTPRTLRNGTEGCVTRSYMQWCIQDQAGDKTLTDQAALRIADMLLEEHALSRAKIDQSLENLLLDEAVRRRKRKRVQ